MTIAAGFRCKDGVVLCADSQETIPDYLKVGTNKIFVFQNQSFYRLAATGAGGSDMIEMVYQQIMDKLRNGPTTPDFVETTIRDVVHKTAIKHVIPYPDSERPWFHLLFAVQFPELPTVLFKTVETAVRRVDDFACVGSVALAHYTAANTDIRQLHACTVRGFAIHLLKQVKDFDPNCGRGSDVLIFYDNDFEYAPLADRYVAAVEHQLDIIHQCTRWLLLESMAHRGTEKGIQDAWEHLHRHMLEFQEWERNHSDERCRLSKECLTELKMIPVRAASVNE